jgi:hypothetical protein
LAGGGGDVVEQAVRVRRPAKSSAKLPTTMVVSSAWRNGLIFMCLLLSMNLIWLIFMLYAPLYKIKIAIPITSYCSYGQFFSKNERLPCKQHTQSINFLSIKEKSWGKIIIKSTECN